jgi:APA family basic amino acid/polyamine antiporter
MTAMLGVLLNLLLGLSRVVLAMGRRGDLPSFFGELNSSRTTPTAAVVGVGGVVTALAALGDVRVTWSFSAFTVLVYYAITNLAALRLPWGDRLYPPFFAWAGLLACLFLAFWVEPQIWLVGLLILAVGLIWHRLRRARALEKTKAVANDRRGSYLRSTLGADWCGCTAKTAYGGISLAIPSK